VAGQEWQRYVAPAAFLLLATIAVILIRAGLESGGQNSPNTTHSSPASPRRHGATTTSTGASPTSSPRFWTVGAGDTFGVIASKSGVPVRTIEQLNPGVKSTSLFIGEKLRIR